jgi:hypothetical protein
VETTEFSGATLPTVISGFLRQLKPIGIITGTTSKLLSVLFIHDMPFKFSYSHAARHFFLILAIDSNCFAH